MAYEAGGQSIAQQTDNIPMPTPTVQSPEAEQQKAQAQAQETRQTPSVFQPITMTRAPNVQPARSGTAGGVSPILLPDPATAALAQQLGRTTR